MPDTPRVRPAGASPPSSHPVPSFAPRRRPRAGGRIGAAVSGAAGPVREESSRRQQQPSTKEAHHADQAAMFHRDNTETFLVHLFGQGLEDERYVVERYRSLANGEIRPAQAEQGKTKGRRKPPRTVASAGAVRRLRPERDEIIVCTGVSLKDSGMQIWGWQATGILAARNAR